MAVWCGRLLNEWGHIWSQASYALRNRPSEEYAGCQCVCRCGPVRWRVLPEIPPWLVLYCDNEVMFVIMHLFEGLRLFECHCRRFSLFRSSVKLLSYMVMWSTSSQALTMTSWVHAVQTWLVCPTNSTSMTFTGSLALPTTSAASLTITNTSCKLILGGDFWPLWKL